jgi:hypothetical protein
MQSDIVKEAQRVQIGHEQEREPPSLHQEREPPRIEGFMMVMSKCDSKQTAYLSSFRSKYTNGNSVFGLQLCMHGVVLSDDVSFYIEENTSLTLALIVPFHYEFSWFL